MRPGPRQTVPIPDAGTDHKTAGASEEVSGTDQDGATTRKAEEGGAGVDITADVEAGHIGDIGIVASG
jgi:hypothetical protein